MSGYLTNGDPHRDYYRLQPDGSWRRWPPELAFLCVPCPRCNAPRGRVCEDTSNRASLVGPRKPRPRCHKSRLQALRDRAWHGQNKKRS